MNESNSNNQAIEGQGTVCVSDDQVHPMTEFCPSHTESSLPTSVDSLVGQLLGEKYLIEEPIGSGGMCQVHRATQVVIGKKVAIKLLHPQLAVDQQYIRRFEIEANTLGRLSHPHAINVFDFGFTSAGCPYLVMDFISGRTLAEVIRLNGPLPVARVNKLLGQICSALQAAHAEGIIHRDIKPENILISAADGEDWATVVDFGIAKLQADVNHPSNLTGIGVIIGTPRYMSPEQSEGKTLDSRSDIYSLGIVLYEMLAGKAPFTDNSSARLLIKHISEMPPPLGPQRPDITKEIEAVVMRALAKDPSERPASALELSKAFEAVTKQVNYETGLPGAATQLVIPLTSEANTADVNRQDLSEEPTQLRGASVQPATPAVSFSNRARTWFARPLGKALAILTLVFVMVLGFIYYQRRSATINSLAKVNATQQAVTLAVAQINLLPKGHLLRDQLSQLNEWQRELEVYTTAFSLPSSAQTRVQTMEKLSKEYAVQAQIAVKQLATSTSVNALTKDAEQAKTDQALKEEAANQPAAKRGSGKKRAKGPNRFTRVVKKIFLMR